MADSMEEEEEEDLVIEDMRGRALWILSDLIL